MRRTASPYASSFSFGPGPLSTAMKALIGANVLVFFAQTLKPVLTSLFGLQPFLVVWPQLMGLAARHLHVPARRGVPHPVQHAGAVDVRDRARTDLGDEILPEVLLRDRHRRGDPHASLLAAAFRRIGAGVRIERHRRVGRDLRAAARVRALLSGPSHLHVPGVPDPGEVFRPDHGDPRLLLHPYPARVAVSPTPRISVACWSRTCISRARA